MNCIKFKRLTLDLDSFRCYFNNKIIDLTKIEFKLLRFFLDSANVNKVFSRKELVNAVWEKEVALKTVDTTISRLKKKLDNTKYIKTKFGFGYGVLDDDVKINND